MLSSSAYATLLLVLMFALFYVVLENMYTRHTKATAINQGV